VVEKPTAPATRGFGGVVTFYGAEQNEPVRVNGNLTIYAYDDLAATGDDSTPDRKYVFTPEQLEKHYGKGPAGSSYHVWIPWDEAGGPRQEVGLIVRFDPVDGKAILGKPTHAVLPGPKDERDRLFASRAQLTPVIPVSHLAAVPSVAGASPATGDAKTSPTPARQTQVTTLDLPGRDVAHHAVSAANAPSPGGATPGSQEQ